MRKALRRAGWVLAAAGGLLTAGPAMAQHLRACSSCCNHGCPAAASCETAALDPEQARAEEVTVELGWLSDPATFGCSLAARVQGGSLNVRGFVPSEAVRRRAVALAQAHTTLPVTDGLHVCEDMAVRMGGGSRPEDLQKQATQLLLEGFPGQAEAFQVQASANGTVMVAGAIPSLEDQLGVSRFLRRLPGCCCVLNQMDVLSAGVAYVTPQGPPDSLAVQRVSYPAPAAPAADNGRVADGMILISGEDRPSPAAVRRVTPPPPPPSPKVLKERIEAVCGRAVRDVKVVPHSGNSVEVHFTLRGRGKGDEVCAKILGMPEFAAYRISFEMQKEP
jgi:hypothetical protein